MGIETLILAAMVTAYRSVPEQTDSTPYHTSINHRTHAYGAAVSQDLLCPAALFRNLKIKTHSAKVCHLKNKWHYGDMVYVEGDRMRVVNDTMNRRHKKWVDLWVATHAEEKRIAPKVRRVMRVRVQ